MLLIRCNAIGSEDRADNLASPEMWPPPSCEVPGRLPACSHPAKLIPWPRSCTCACTGRALLGLANNLHHRILGRFGEICAHTAEGKAMLRFVQSNMEEYTPVPMLQEALTKRVTSRGRMEGGVQAQPVCCAIYQMAQNFSNLPFKQIT